MVKNIKILLQFILALALMVLYITGCMPDVPGLFSAELSGDKDIGEEVSLIKSTSDGDVEDLDSRLNDLKEGLVSSPVILSHVSGQKIFGSGDKEVIYLYGLAEKGNEIEVYVNGLLEQVGIVVDENGKFETVSGIEIIKGKNIIELVERAVQRNSNYFCQCRKRLNMQSTIIQQTWKRLKVIIIQKRIIRMFISEAYTQQVLIFIFRQMTA